MKNTIKLISLFLLIQLVGCKSNLQTKEGFSIDQDSSIKLKINMDLYEMNKNPMPLQPEEELL